MLASFEASLTPTEFIAETLYVYFELGDKLVCEYVVEVLSVLSMIVVNEPESFFTSILYPVMAELPSDAGSLQDRLI